MRKWIALLLAVMKVICLFTGCNVEKRKVINYESPEQQAVVETALSYLARSYRIQYDDSRLATGDIVPSDVRYRWQYGLKSPEDATSQYYAYTNCAAFTYDVYGEALEYDILYNTTAKLIQAHSDQMVYKYFPKGNETEEEMAAVEKKFRDSLKMGDIIVVRYNGSRKGNGHAMLYVGADVLENVIPDNNNQQEGVENTATTTAATENTYVYDIIHSTGSSYSYSGFAEKFEKNGSIAMTSVDMMFNPESSRYVFSKLLSFGIVRPLNTYQGGVPEKTQNRVNNLYGIMAEKLCDRTVGMTINPGEEMTFTFNIQNNNSKSVTLEVKDNVPANTTYITGTGGVTISNGDLTWNVKVPAFEAKQVSYTVRVNADAAYGDEVYSDAGTVGGVDTDCPPVTIAKTLTASEQEAIRDAITQCADSELRGMMLADAIYNKALGTKDLLADDFDTVICDIFDSYLGTPDYFTPRTEGKYAEMLIPTMYGGRYTVPDIGATERLSRTRLPYADQLMIGDILIAAEGGDNSSPRVYLLAGDVAYDLLNENGLTSENCATRLEKVLGYNRFAILRPSFARESK